MSKLKSFQIDVADLTSNIALSDISDIVITTAADNDILIYDSVSGTWKNEPETGIPSATWGSIVGTLSNQLDLQTALDLKTDTVTFDTHTAGSALNHTADAISFDDTNTNLGTGSPSSITEVQTAIEKIVSNHYYIDLTTGTGSPLGITETSLPLGWTTTYNSVGNFTVTHTLGNTTVGLALSVLYNGTARVINPTAITTNAITFQITDTLNAGVEGNVIGKLLF